MWMRLLGVSESWWREGRVEGGRVEGDGGGKVCRKKYSKGRNDKERGN